MAYFGSLSRHCFSVLNFSRVHQHWTNFRSACSLKKFYSGSGISNWRALAHKPTAAYHQATTTARTQLVLSLSLEHILSKYKREVSLVLWGHSAPLRRRQEFRHSGQLLVWHWLASAEIIAPLNIHSFLLIRPTNFFLRLSHLTLNQGSHFRGFYKRNGPRDHSSI